MTQKNCFLTRRMEKIQRSELNKQIDNLFSFWEKKKRFYAAMNTMMP